MTQWTRPLPGRTQPLTTVGNAFKYFDRGRVTAGAEGRASADQGQGPYCHDPDPKPLQTVFLPAVSLARALSGRAWVFSITGRCCPSRVTSSIDVAYQQQVPKKRLFLKDSQ